MANAYNDNGDAVVYVSKEEFQILVCALMAVTKSGGGGKYHSLTQDLIKGVPELFDSSGEHNGLVLLMQQTAAEELANNM